MEGLDRDFLQQELVYRPVGTVLFSGDGLQATDAAPDDGLAAVVVPVNAPVKLAAVSAENHLCKTVIAGEAAFLACRADVDYPATDFSSPLLNFLKRHRTAHTITTSF